MILERSSGFLLHVTSLPSRFGIGDLGPVAYRFVDACVNTDQRVWQMLPVGPVAFGYSPYASPSTFAGNPLLISPEQLASDGLLENHHLDTAPSFPEDSVDFELVIPYKRQLLLHAWERFDTSGGGVLTKEFEAFCAAHADWLDDYALFAALKERYGELAWTSWPPPLAHRNRDALISASHVHAQSTRRHKFWQFLFARQWNWLQAYCKERGVHILGDVPIYVAHDSADVWSAPELFYLDETGNPAVVGGVPPDFFSTTGQRWGNPLYRWDRMAKRNFAWWTDRMQHALSLFDMIRLDHFRGFAAYWEIPASEETAVRGRWVDGPGAALFDRMRIALGALPILAENLGVITDDVTALMHHFEFPGMAVLQFAFGHDSTSEHLPHNYKPQVIAYTGTHDNDTLAGWWDAAADHERVFARRYLELADGDHDLHMSCLRMLMASAAGLVITPLQDVLALPSSARMNTPGTVGGNWNWRMLPGELDALFHEPGARLRAVTQMFGRAPDTDPAAGQSRGGVQPS